MTTKGRQILAEQIVQAVKAQTKKTSVFGKAQQDRLDTLVRHGADVEIELGGNGVHVIVRRPR